MAAKPKPVLAAGNPAKAATDRGGTGYFFALSLIFWSKMGG